VTHVSITDYAFGFQVYRGRTALQAAMRDDVRTLFMDDVGTDGGAEAAFEKLYGMGARLIFSSSSELADGAWVAAERHPDARFVQFLGERTRENVATCAIRDWEGAFVCGVVAAHVVGPDKRLGFVAPHPGAPTPWNVNAFLLGARSVHPAATVDLAITGSWYDPDAEVRAVGELASRGVDAAYFLVISPVKAIEAADQRGLFYLTHFSDHASYAPAHWVTAAVWEWLPYYRDATQRMLAGTWTSDHRELGFREGCLRLAPCGPAVDDAARATARQATERIASGDLDVFRGPLRDGDGNEVLAEGEVLDPPLIRAARWLLDGVRLPNPREETPRIER
jgi:basic membrane lipoprotein Med (substrate-binding protein (PBP1-ABC) superfamily)